MFELCLFDLDDTLVRTEDLEKIRAAGKDNDTKEYRAKVGRAYLVRDREVYTDEILGEIRKEFPDLKLGVFTRSPRAYAESILQHAYPFFKWDVVITYDDVKRTKPYGEGIKKAMHTFGLKRLDRVLMVGDQESDIRAAYNAGVAVVLDTTTWGPNRTYDNWNSIGRIPDAIIQSPDELIQVIKNIPKFQPDLERLLAGESESVVPRRFDRVGKFIHKSVAQDKTSYDIFTGSLNSDFLSRLDPDASAPTGFAEERIAGPETGRVRDVAEGPDGAIWFLSVSDGAAYRMAPGG